ncbi:MAG: alpha/beta hydrolase [Pseudomonadota bacterium]|nr:alpha/beta hydrolase [Pseudomonadota bacterium]
MGQKLELAVAILNGAVGDYLHRTENGLATEMACFMGGAPLVLEREALALALPSATGRIAVLVHGVMCTEDIWAFPDGRDYGSLLARDLGFTPLYVRYNSGLAIPDNGEALDRLLAAVVAAWPVPIEEIVPIGYSMGGLVLRSACHAARTRDVTLGVGGTGAAPPPVDWLAHVRRAIYVGTPHLGAPMERLGRVVARILHAVPDPTTRLVAQIADLRSHGVKDLGDADLRHADRKRRGLNVGLRDARHPVPLLAEIEHFLVAGALYAEPWLATLLGDSIVPVSSATAGPGLAADNVRLLPGLSHMALAHHPDVYRNIRMWCGGAPEDTIPEEKEAGWT